MARHLAKKSKAHFDDIDPREWYEVAVKISAT